jgi:predicted Zn-dependent protease
MRIMELSEAVKKEPANGLFHFELALLLAEFNLVTNAIPHFAESVKLLPNETRPKVDYAQALYITGDPDGAIKQVNEALKLDNENPLIQHRLAWLLLNKPDADSLHFTFARDLLIKANAATNYLELNFLRNLAQAYFRNKEYRDASHIGRMALERAEDIGMVEFANTLRKELSDYESALAR